MSLVVSPLAQMRSRFGCDIASLPAELGVLAWDGREKSWHSTFGTSDRLTALLGLLRPVFAGRSDSWWHTVCLDDALGERQLFQPSYRMGDFPWDETSTDGPEVLPSVSLLKPRVLCFGAHHGDPRALLMPDPHFLFHGYRKLKAQLLLERRPWSTKQARAVYAGGDHGEWVNFTSPRPGDQRHPRRVLCDLAPGLAVPLDVSLNSAVSRRDQLAAMVVLDVDGFARTWDAWAWKMMGGSVTVSQESVWRSYFSQQFTAWEHFVPMSNDFADLAERVRWCLDNPGEAHEIARRARRRAREVYTFPAVRRHVAAVLATTQ